MPNWSKGMTEQRYREIEDSGFQLELTDAELKAGWHFCEDWDGLLIHLDDEEAEACLCGFKKSHARLVGLGKKSIADKRTADKIDGYDRDDLGESPDW